MGTSAESELESPKSGRFEFQKWPVYRQSLEFSKMAQQISMNLPKDKAKNLIDQLVRASQSVPLNIAEGSARRTKKDKVNFFRIARGSVFECVAALDLVQVLGYSFDVARMQASQRLLVELGKMLSGLISHVENWDERKCR